MEIIKTLARWIVGGLFIFSGLIKLNDPVGTEIKLEEYFEVFAVDFAGFFESLVPMAMPLGMLLIILEVVLGIAVLIKYRMDLVSWVLLLLILFFTFLTFYSAYFDKVTDCGCFGDAIPLTPWQSFSKDLVLLVLIGIIFIYKKSFQPFFEDKRGFMILSLSTLVSLFLGIYAIKYLPFIDFRPYAIGENIAANMVPPEQPIFEYTFKKDGKEVTSTKYLLETDGFEYVGYKVNNLDKTVPKITDYNVWNDEDGDYTKRSFEGIHLLFIAYNILDADTKSMVEAAELFNTLEGKMKTIALTSSSSKDFEAFRHQYQLAMPYYFADATVLKAMIRANPGIMLMKDGNVLGKWHFNDVPDLEDVVDLL